MLYLVAGSDVSMDVNLPQLRIVDVGGEALGADVVSTWAPGRLLSNSYGPTEISVVCAQALTCGRVIPLLLAPLCPAISATFWTPTPLQ